jgi:hypothetical protein
MESLYLFWLFKAFLKHPLFTTAGNCFIFKLKPQLNLRQLFKIKKIGVSLHALFQGTTKRWQRAMFLLK